VKIHDNSWIGAGATILPKIVINKNVIVGAGALVNKDVEADSVVVGIPAKTLRKKR
jgi:acetyltransferase-like isoleucine patch superfamily enzyme